MAEHSDLNDVYGKLTANDFYRLIKEDPALVQKLSKVANKGVSFLGNKALSKIKEAVGSRGLTLLTPTELPMSVFFYAWGISANKEGKDEVELLWSAGKFVVLSITSGPLGFALGIPSLALRVIGYLDKKETEGDEKRWRAIALSMHEKYLGIRIKVEKKKLEALQREVMHDVNESLIWNPVSKKNLKITVTDHAITLMILDKFLFKTFNTYNECVKKKYRHPIQHPSLSDIEQFVDNNKNLISHYHDWHNDEENDAFFVNAIESWASAIIDKKDLTDMENIPDERSAK